MAENPLSFVKWKEEFVSQEKGRRVVHFYLEDSNGDSHLAVVGTERSLRHMLYVASEDFCMTRFGFCDKSRASSFKWRSRREAVDWLSSFLPMTHIPQRLNGFLEAQIPNNGLPGEIRDGKSDIEWVGASWVCGKNLTHYNAFSRNQTTISAHSFALIMSEQDNRYLAYIEDMYEDKKGEKKVKVRWFHQNQEFDSPIPPPAPHRREVFLTPYTQVISVECVDDLATVLTPEDYSRIHSLSSSSLSSTTRLCFRQYCKSKFRYFDLRTLKGYYTQPQLLSLSSSASSLPRTNSMNRRLYASRYVHDDNTVTRLPPGPRNQVKPAYLLGQRIEVLSQDSGIRGCWFRCTVLELRCRQVKVRYDDLLNVDEEGNLEEWVKSNKYADPDKLGMRIQNRLTIRPAPSEEDESSDDVRFVVGRAVDVWRSDGWWEGVVIKSDDTDDDDNYNYFEDKENRAELLKVYFPGEEIYLECKRKDVRVSRDWNCYKWVEIERKPNVLTLIASSSNGENDEEQVEATKQVESGSSAMSDQIKEGSKKRARDETIKE